MRVGGSAAVDYFGGRLHVGRICCVLGGTLYWALGDSFSVGLSTGSAVRANGTVLNVRLNSAQVGTILVSQRGEPVTRNDRA